MGIFSSKTKHIYTPYSACLYEKMPSLLKQTIAGAVGNNRNIASDLKANLTHGILAKTTAYYNNARSKNHPWGLPNGTYGSLLPVRNERVALIIEAETKQQIHLGYCHMVSTGSSFLYEAEYWLINRGDIDTSIKFTWTYDTALKKYPVLEPEEAIQEVPYYPITPLRINNENYSKGHYHYQAVRRSISFLDLKAHTLFKNFEDAEKESGESTADDQFIVLAPSVATDTEVGKEYLFRFWRKQHGEAACNENDHIYWNQRMQEYEKDPDKHNVPPPLPVNILTIADSRYKQELEWDYTSHHIKDGVVCKKGKYKTTYIPGLGTIPFFHFFRATQTLVIQHQISNDQYEEILVHGLVCRYLVCSGGWVNVDLDDAFTNPDEPVDGQCFLVPLRKDICKDMGPIRSHDLMYESIRLFSNDHQTYKKKWYQRGIFKVLVLVVAIVINCISIGTTTPLTIAMVSALTIVASIIISKVVMPLLQDLLGDVGALLASLVIAYFVPDVIGELAGQMGVEVATTAVTTTALETAAQIGQVAIQAIGGVASINMQDKLKKLNERSQSISEKLEELYDTGDKDPYQLDRVVNGIRNDPFYLMEPSTYVKRKLLAPRHPLLMIETTANYVASQQKLDTSRTALNLGNA